MIMSKLVLSSLAIICAIVSFIIGLKSYSLALRNEIRLKYLRNSWQDGVDELIEKEYARRYFTTISIVVVFLLLFAAVTYLAILCVKNDVSLL